MQGSGESVFQFFGGCCVVWPKEKRPLSKFSWIQCCNLQHKGSEQGSFVLSSYTFPGYPEMEIRNSETAYSSLTQTMLLSA